MVTQWDLLKQATELIPGQTVQYRKRSGVATVNSFGIVASPYAAAVAVKGAHVQPIPSKMFAQLGLQPGRNARRVFVRADLEGMEAQYEGGDLLLFEGRTWKIVSVDNWYGYDGWKALVAVEEKTYPAIALSSGGNIGSGAVIS